MREYYTEAYYARILNSNVNYQTNKNLSYGSSQRIHPPQSMYQVHLQTQHTVPSRFSKNNGVNEAFSTKVLRYRQTTQNIRLEEQLSFGLCWFSNIKFATNKTS